VGYILKQPEVEGKCLFILDTLSELPELIAA